MHVLVTMVTDWKGRGESVTWTGGEKPAEPHWSAGRKHCCYGYVLLLWVRWSGKFHCCLCSIVAKNSKQQKIKIKTCRQHSHWSDPPDFHARKIEIPRSENANSALKNRILSSKIKRFCAEKMPILHSKTALNRPPRILHSENGIFSQCQGKYSGPSLLRPLMGPRNWSYTAGGLKIKVQ